MIDDSLKHIQECIQQGVGRCILYNRPWNQEPLLKGATRVDSWYEISGILRPSVCISQH
ncbi:MAG: hypothetical protein LBC61_03775 [Candidatus Peribacteria bacterium]|jgi:hypothetical protein|nr:hypothetical protein [Candidatus Peribacteria bacterium]